MKNGNDLRAVICAIVFPAAMLTGPAGALAQGVGPPLGGSVTTHFLTGGGWEIDDGSGNPQPVTLDPNGLPWAKELTGPGPSPPGPVIAAPGDTFTIHERLIIGGTLDWADWHEEILTPDWEFVGPIDLLTNGTSASGLTFNTTPASGTSGGDIWFDFDPVPPGTLIDVVKSIQYVGDPGTVFQGSIRMIEYPTPEPATLALLGVGGLALLRARRRRKCRT